MENPRRFISEPGSEEKQQRQDNFFEEVLGMLGYDDHARATFCEIRSREIAKGDETDLHLTDDRITELLARGVTIAMIIEIRNDLNYTQVHLAHFITPMLLQQLELPPQ